jgi:hypothetical protein
LQLCGANEAQRSLRPNERLVSDLYVRERLWSIIYIKIF